MTKLKKSTKHKIKIYSCILLVIMQLFLFCFQPFSFASNLGNALSGLKQLSIENVTGVLDSLMSQFENSYNFQTINPESEITVIVQTNGEPLADNLKTTRYNSLNEYSGSDEGKVYSNYLKSNQDSLKRRLSQSMSITYQHSYTTLLNGFAATVKYKDLDRLSNFSGITGISMSQTYSLPEEEYGISNPVDIYGTGIYDISGVDFDGSGTVVAIFDTGMDYTHPAFQTMPQDISLTKNKLNETLPGMLSFATSGALKASDVYLSDKIPYAFDYADKTPEVYPRNSHGTHVAGIVAGYDENFTWKPEGMSESSFKGVAPGAQLAIFKVFSSNTEFSSARTEDIIMGLEDAAILGVDVINMSLGSSSGFAYEDDMIDSVYEKLREAGISVIVSAGNEGNSASGSKKGSTNLTSNPDSATVGSPSSYSQAMSVASINGVKSDYFIANGSTIGYIEESNDISGKSFSFAGTLLGNKNDYEYTYVTVPGVGNASNFAAVDVKGKIALVKRGILNFEDKIKNAYNAGAIGIIIYNNISGSLNISVGKSTMIPSCSVTMDIGEILNKQSSGTLYLNKDYKAGPFISSFSSWGVLPNLELKPEITAHGGTITSTVPGGYDTISGTSMAAPNMAGIMTVLRQYIKENFPALSAVEVSELANRLIMSTATIAKNQDNNPYSPRKQGAGLASLYNAVNTNAYLSIDGSDKTKISAGDDKNKTGEYKLSFRLNNLSGTSKSYRIITDVFTESVSSDGKTVSEKAYMLNNASNTISVSGGVLSGNVVSVSGYGNAEITVTIKLTDEEKRYIDNNFENGMFVEGFVELISLDNDIDLSVPWVSFYGDWLRAPILDLTAYEVGASQKDSSVLDEDKLKEDIYASRLYAAFDSSDGYGYWGLGEYIFVLGDESLKPAILEEKSALSQDPNSYFQLYSVALGALRNIKYADVEIINTVTGEVIFKNTRTNIRKSIYSSGQYYPGAVELELNIMDLNLANNTKYTVNVTCYLDYGDGGAETNLKNTFSSSFYVDSQAPILIDDGVELRIEERNKEKRYYVDLYVYDNHYLQGVYAATYQSVVDGSLFNMTPFDYYVTPIDSGFNTVNKVTFDITDYWNLIRDNGNKFYFEFMDYAKNHASFLVTLPEEPTESVSFKTGTINLDINRTADLNEQVILIPENAWKYGLTYESLDEEIAIVSEKGIITGVSAGETEIRVTALNSKGKPISNTIKVKVSSTVYTPKLEKIELNRPIWDAVQGDEGELEAAVYPYNYTNADLVWTSSHPRIVEVTGIAGTNKATFKVLGSSKGVVTITAYDKNSGIFISSSCNVSIKALFETDGQTLKKYNGKGTTVNGENGVVAVPDDLDILYISAYAFRNNRDIKKVILPNGAKYIENYAFSGCTNLVEVVLPKTMEDIGVGSFSNCEKLTKINLENVKIIGAYAFSATSLSSVNLDSAFFIGDAAFMGNGYSANCMFTELNLINTRYIGYGAFTYCLNLQEVTVSTYNIFAETFAGCTKLKSIVFTEKVAIHEYAFAYCEKLTDVKFYKGCTTIGYLAFYGCGALTSFTLPDGLESIGFQAFYACLSLEEIIISQGVKITSFGPGVFANTKVSTITVEPGNSYLSSKNGVLYDITGTELLLFPNYKEPDDNGKKGNFVVPGEVRIIGKGAFAGVALVTSIEFNNVITIKDNAFYNATSLSSITFNGNQKYIDDYAFANCGAIKLSSLKNASSLVYIGDGAFSYAGDATEKITLELPVSVSHIGTNAFENCYSIEIIDLEKNINLKVFSEGLFNNCTNVTSVLFPDGIRELGAGVFQNCFGLTSIELPDSITTLGSGGFYGCENLVYIKLSSNIKSIPEFFLSYTAVTEIEMPSSVTTIEAYAFYGSGSFAKFTGAELNNIKEIYSNAFSYTLLTELIIPNVTFLGSSLFTDLGSSGVAQNTSLIKVIAPKAETIDYAAFWFCINLAEVDISAAKNIGGAAFMYCESLTAIGIPNAEVIGEYCFSYTSITTLKLPKSLQSIDEQALIRMIELENIEVDKDNTKFFSLDGVLHSYLPAGGYQLEIYPAKKEGKSYTVADGVKRIANRAFINNIYLYEITLSRTLKSIGDGAFMETAIRIFIFTSPALPILESYCFEIEADYYINLYCNFSDADIQVKDERLVNVPLVDGLIMVAPSNGTGYDNYIAQLFFKTILPGNLAITDSVLAVIDFINKLPDTITLGDAIKIEEARTAYNNLSRSQQQQVSNFDRLLNAENTLADLRKASQDGGNNGGDDNSADTAKILAWVFGSVSVIAIIAAMAFMFLFFKKRNISQSQPSEEIKKTENDALKVETAEEKNIRSQTEDSE